MRAHTIQRAAFAFLPNAVSGGRGLKSALQAVSFFKCVFCLVLGGGGGARGGANFFHGHLVWVG